MEKEVTIKDIAKMLNLSKSTVSRALQDNVHVNNSTKEKVLSLAKELDYLPNYFSKCLVTKKSYKIGIIVPELSTSFFPRVIEGAQSHARKHGYSLFISYSNESMEVEKENIQQMLSNRVDGVLLSLSRQTNEYRHLDYLIEKEVPLVLFNRVCEEVTVPKVIIDDFDSSFKLVSHLVKSGHKKFLYVYGPQNLIIARKRLSGFLNAMKKFAIGEENIMTISSDELELNNYKILIDLWNDKTLPEAICTFNDPIAIEISVKLRNAGARVPEDVSIAGFSDDIISQYMIPSITSVSQPAELMGKEAIDLLIKQIEKPGSVSNSLCKILPSELVIRDSTS